MYFLNGISHFQTLVSFFYRHGIQTPVNQAMVFFVKALEAKFLGDKQNWEIFD